MSADGSRLVAMAESGIYLSTNGGTSWVRASSRVLNGIYALRSMTSSSDGALIIAGQDGDGVLFISYDGGMSWTI